MDPRHAKMFSGVKALALVENTPVDQSWFSSQFWFLSQFRSLQHCIRLVGCVRHDFDTKQDGTCLATCVEQWDESQLSTEHEWQGFQEVCNGLKGFYTVICRHYTQFDLKFDVVPAAVGFLKT
jgi:hypothetical protein